MHGSYSTVRLGIGDSDSGLGSSSPVLQFRGGLVFKAHRLCVSLNSRLESNKEEEDDCPRGGVRGFFPPKIVGCYVTKFAPHKALTLIA